MYQSIEDEVCRCIDLFEKCFEGHTFYKVSRPEIIFAPLTIDAAQCLYAFDGHESVFGNIVFNSHMVDYNFEKYIEVVTPHETSHWCTAILNGYLNDEEQNLNHGYTWKQMMAFFEADDRACIFDLHAPVIQGLHQYGCACCTVNLNDQEVEEYSIDLCCPNCGCDYKLLLKGSNDEEDNS